MAKLGMVNYETREVLAGSNKSKAALLTHTVKWSESLGGEAVPLCSRVKAANIADKYSMDDADREMEPTCPVCRARDPRFAEAR